MGRRQAGATAAVWTERVAAWKRSGLSAEAFAARYAVSPKTLAWWKWKLATPRVENSASLTLVPVRIAAPSAAAAEGTTPIEVEIEGCIVRVRAGFDRAALAAVVDVLRGGRR